MNVVLALGRRWGTARGHYWTPARSSLTCGACKGSGEKRGPAPEGERRDGAPRGARVSERKRGTKKMDALHGAPSPRHCAEDDKGTTARPAPVKEWGWRSLRALIRLLVGEDKKGTPRRQPQIP